MKKSIEYFDLSIWPYCNKNCIFCSEWWKGKRFFVSLKDFKELYLNYNIKKIVLTWGEPLFNKNILEYIKIGVKNNTIMSLVTSWTEKLDKDFLFKLLESWLSEIMFSLEWPEVIHDNIVKKKWAYKIILKALYDLTFLKKKFNFKLIINSNINLINYKILPNFIVSILKNFNIDVYHIQWLQLEWNAIKNEKILFWTYYKLLYYFNINRKIKKVKNKIKFWRVPFCVLNKDLHIAHTNTNYNIKIYNNKWLSDTNYLNDKVILKKCKDCIKLSSCELFFKYYIDKYWSFEINPIKDEK
jgi:MoaA/NifB/PqqE/SkfB family radical SAM enzyme